MLKRVRASLSYANVMATIAVFAALGGVSYAAVNLPKNSVGASQLEKNAVRSADVKNGSLLCKDFKKSQDACKTNPIVRSTFASLPLTCSETGAGGNFFLNCQTAVTTVKASCKSGERATGGGYKAPSFTQGNSNSGANIEQNGPDPGNGSPVGWEVHARGFGNNTGTTSPVAKPPDPQVTAYAVCVPS